VFVVWSLDPVGDGGYYIDVRSVGVVKAGCVDKPHFPTIDICTCSLDTMGAYGLVRREF